MSEKPTISLIPREHGFGGTFWIVGRRPYFLAQKTTGYEIWYSHRPHGANERVHVFPAGDTPSLAEIDAVIGEIEEMVDNWA